MVVNCVPVKGRCIHSVLVGRGGGTTSELFDGDMKFLRLMWQNTRAQFLGWEWERLRPPPPGVIPALTQI